MSKKTREKPQNFPIPVVVKDDPDVDYKSADAGTVDIPFVPTEQQWDTVYNLAKDGLSIHQIRHYVMNSKGYAVSVPTITKYFQDAFDAGVADMTAAVSRKLIGTALFDDSQKPNPIVSDARKFVLKCKGNWSEKQEPTAIELTGKDGEAIEHDHTVSIDASAELAAILGQIKRTKAGSSEEDPSVVQNGEGKTTTD